MLAPEPFFEPRGTPFSEYHRIRALGELGYHVDLVTYPFGSDVALPYLRIIRSPGVPFVRRVGVGPSVAKLLLDLGLLRTAWRVARGGDYDAVHSHEEAAFFGVWLARRLGVPHLYDMHSSLPQQLGNFRYAFGRLWRPVFAWLERRAVAGSAVVITICQELQELAVRLAGDEGKVVLIENVMGGETPEAPSLDAQAIRERWGIAPDQVVVLYAGTFEPYQGIDLLIDAAAVIGRTHPSVVVLLVGGEPPQVAAAARRVAALRAPVVLAGAQPAREIPAFIEAADILVSPRVAGTNTPLKIYSYLQSGRPIVATRLRTHTQVLDPTVAVLVPPEPQALAAGITQLVDDPPLRRRLAAAAREMARARYSRASYLGRTAEAYARLWRARPAGGPVAAPSQP
jgi:glycosyltransferase involved in cell wall biosynthesis